MANSTWPAAGFLTKFPASGTTNWPSSSSGKFFPNGFTPAGPTFTVTPQLSFGAQNFDGSNNSTLTDGQLISTWVNTGTYGTASNATQGTAGNQFTFRKVAVAGKINSLSAAEATDANRFMQAAITSQAQPYMFSCLIRNTKAATQVYLSTGVGPVDEFYSTTTTDHIQCGTDVDTALTAPANQFSTRVISANGASSFLRLNGVQSASLGAGAQASLAVVTLMRDASSLGTIGFAVEFQFWVGSLPTAASVEASYQAYYGGAFPQ